MNMKLLLIAVMIFTASTAFLVLQTASSASTRNTNEGTLSSGISADAPIKLADQPEDTGASVPSMASNAGGQAEILRDGKSILQDRCQACHIVESLEAMKKTRTQWEKALAKMAGFGVELSYSEKSILLDYLSVSD